MTFFSAADQFMATLMAYREAQDQGDVGITAVLCIARNNALRHKTTVFEEITKLFRYSSINCPMKVTPNNTAEIQGLVLELSKYPRPHNSLDWSIWTHIESLTIAVLSGVTSDITNGATLYYNPKAIDSDKTIKLPDGSVIKFPKDWDASKVKFTTHIKDQYFFLEL